MDNRITKTRLSNFLAYEWILMIFLCAVVIFAWEIIYSISGVKLNPGQDYRFFYDYYLFYGSNYNDLLNELDAQGELGYSNGKTFSYEVQNIDAEPFIPNNDIMYVRLSAQEGDLLITDDKSRDTYGKNVLYKQSMAKVRVDNFDEITTLENLLANAKSYLSGLLYSSDLEISAENLDPVKVKQGFDQRLSDDNRFRSEAEKQMGVQLETERLGKLCKEYKDFEKVMSMGDEFFFRYTKFTQFLEISTAQGLADDVIKKHETNIATEIAEGRENAKYGIRINEFNKIKTKIDGSIDLTKKDVSKFFSLVDEETDTSKHVVLMVFSFEEYQPELQFESMTVINNIIRACSTVLD